jgi:hypothetical protein
VLLLLDFLLWRLLPVFWLRSRRCWQLDSLPARDPVATDAGRPADMAADFESLPVFDLILDDVDAKETDSDRPQDSSRSTVESAADSVWTIARASCSSAKGLLMSRFGFLRVALLLSVRCRALPLATDPMAALACSGKN